MTRQEAVQVLETYNQTYGYERLTKVIGLPFITLGIYYFIWIYQVTEFFNKYGIMQQRNSALQVIVSIIFPPYILYWFIETTKRLDVFTDKGEDNALMVFLVALFIFPVAIGIVQDKINCRIVELSSAR